MSDAVRLTVPHVRRYHGVVRLVVAGLAARLDFPYEELEDVQLALETLLGSDVYVSGEEVTVEVSLGETGLEIAVGPLDGRRLERELAAEPDESRGVGLRRLLSTVTGGFEVERRDGREWVRMRKDAPRGVARA
jgi:anti-sigma regulatory factor (Ser/Thr protein kinase)